MSVQASRKNEDVVDVVVVGAGLSGLVAARRVHERGASVRILEAKARVGGRLKNIDLASGATVDGGGAWVGPQQTAILALLGELGISTFSQHGEGRSLVRYGGRKRSYLGETPTLDPLALMDLGIAQFRLDRLARKFRGPEAWASRSAQRIDCETLGDWMRRHVRTRGARFVLDLVTATSFGCRPGELSLLAFATHVGSAGGLQSMIGVKGGALQWRIAGGAASVPFALEKGLGDRVALNRPVQRIDQTREDFVLLETQGETLRARSVIVAVDPATAQKLEHRPALPALRANLQRRYTLGSGRKVFVVYETPFWREKGFSGQVVSDAGLVRITFDNSPADLSAGVLVTFLGLAIAEDPAYLEESAGAERKRRVVDELGQWFGKPALRPVDYVEQDWSAEAYQSGCLPSLAPGVLTSSGHCLVQPHDRVHWAGSETSDVWEGHMDGAVRAGERAAKEVIARFVE